MAMIRFSMLDEYGCSTAELSEEQKNEISHRGKALRAMKAKPGKGISMRVLIISDTHRKHENLLKVLERVEPIDPSVHLRGCGG